MLLQGQSTQQPAAGSRTTEPIILDSAADTPMSGLSQTCRINTPHHQHGLTSAQAVSSQIGLASKPPLRFGSDYSAPPGFTATPPAAAHGPDSGLKSPSQRLGLLAARGPSSADPKSQVLEKLMEELSGHQPYGRCAPLPAASTQQPSMSTTREDLDAMIARYACREHARPSARPYQLASTGCLPCCKNLSQCT